MQSMYSVAPADWPNKDNSYTIYPIARGGDKVVHTLLFSKGISLKANATVRLKFELTTISQSNTLVHYATGTLVKN